jgi:hypothetical protein
MYCLLFLIPKDAMVNKRVSFSQILVGRQVLKWVSYSILSGSDSAAGKNDAG